MEITLNLVVIRAADLELSQRFYEALGMQFTRERHGSGPEHLAAELGDVVFEIYPRGSGPATVGVRLGIQVASVEAAVSAVQQLRAEVATPPATRPGAGERWSLTRVGCGWKSVRRVVPATNSTTL